jgi:hypothetical protein
VQAEHAAFKVSVQARFQAMEEQSKSWGVVACVWLCVRRGVRCVWCAGGRGRGV